MRQPGGPGGAEKEIVIINGKLWDEFAESCVALDEAVKQFLDRVRIKFGKVERIEISYVPRGCTSTLLLLLRGQFDALFFRAGDARHGEERFRAPFKIQSLARTFPATYVVFDLLYDRSSRS